MAFDMLEALTLIAREKSIELETVIEALEASLGMSTTITLPTAATVYFWTCSRSGPCRFQWSFPRPPR